MWLAMLVAAAVLVGCGVFFAFQDLGKANAYASIASFFLALVTAAGSVLSRARSKSVKGADNKGEENQHQGHGARHIIAIDNDLVQTGDNAIGNVTKTVILPPRERNHRRR